MQFYNQFYNAVQTWEPLPPQALHPNSRRSVACTAYPCIHNNLVLHIHTTSVFRQSEV